MNSYKVGDKINKQDLKFLAEKIIFSTHSIERFGQRISGITIEQIRQLTETSCFAFKGADNDYIINLGELPFQIIVTDGFVVKTVINKDRIGLLKCWGANVSGYRNLAGLHAEYNEGKEKRKHGKR